MQEAEAGGHLGRHRGLLHSLRPCYVSKKTLFVLIVKIALHFVPDTQPKNHFQYLVADLCHFDGEGSQQTLNVSVPVTEGACSVLSHQGQYNGFLSRSRCVISSSRQMA